VAFVPPLMVSPFDVRKIFSNFTASVGGVCLATMDQSARLKSKQCQVCVIDEATAILGT
jgi:hypothetical protein